MVKQQIKDQLKKAAEELGFLASDIEVSSSSTEGFGDYSSNIALQLAKLENEKGQQSAREIANDVVEKGQWEDLCDDVQVAGPGFINFFVKPSVLAEDVKKISQDFGRNTTGQGKKIQVEFISANPTGPLTLANGRGGAMGDALANVLQWSGFEVEREYYVNDTGNQVRLLADSVKARAGMIAADEKHYQGEYVSELQGRFADQLEEDSLQLGHLLADHFMAADIKPAIARLGIQFDRFYSERSLYESDAIEKALEALKKSGYTYEKDGAVWFKSTEFGDEKDRVLITSEEGGRGRQDPTYFLADIAYHLNVFDRGFDQKINLWGADHHGYEPRIQAAIKALGFEGRLHIIFMQMVKLFREGQEVRMSKRAGNFVTLDELLELVSADVVRFFFLMYAPETHINFNLDLAQEQSNKNPVFYVQYAHARMASILAKEEGAGEVAELNHPREKELMVALLKFPEMVEEISKSYQVHQLTGYAVSLADSFHRFYEQCQVLGNPSRVELVRATKIVLGNTLGLLGVTAPEKM